MLTVNLEKQLIKQNKKVLLPEELLSIKEYERLGDDVCESEVLSRVGLNKVARWGKASKKQLEAVNSKLAHFDQERVFHISQIESICEKYHLRFLGTGYFKGSVDAALALKISTFEVAYQQECNNTNCSIVAPISSFELEERPKDPLFFFDLGDGYWYLIHKWGNDLSWFRRTYKLLSNGLVTWLLICLTPCLLFFKYGKVFEKTKGHTDITVLAVLLGLYLVGYSILAMVIYLNDDGAIRLVRKNDWRSSYK